MIDLTRREFLGLIPGTVVAAGGLAAVPTVEERHRARPEPATLP
jgi:hypothetical protein